MCQCSRSSETMPRNWRAKLAPEPNSVHAPDDAQLGDELLGVVEHRRSAQGQAQAAGRDGRRQPAHRLRPLGLGVLAVVRLVDDERPRSLARQRPVMRGDHLVVDDRDLGRRRDRPAPVDHGDGTVGQPALGLALPAELHRGRADHDRRVGAVRLQGGQRLDGLAQSLLVGQERSAGLQRVAHRGPLKRRGLAAEDGRGLGERLGLGGARAPDRISGVAVLGQQPLQHVDRLSGDRDVVAGDEGVQRLGKPGIQRNRSGAVGARKLGEAEADVGVPQDLQAQLLPVHPADVDQSRRGRITAVLHHLQAPLGGDVEVSRALSPQRLRRRQGERREQPAVVLDRVIAAMARARGRRAS